MQKIIKFLIIAIVIVVFAFILILKTPLAKYPVSFYLSNALDADISIKKCYLSFTKGIKADDVIIKNKKGLYCTIKDADIKYNLFGLLKRELVVDCSLKLVKFSYSASEIINGISRLFAIEPSELLEFDTVNGIVYIKPKELIIRDLNVAGKDISFFADGTTKEGEYINYSLKLTLSQNITSKIPEAIRKLFFTEKQEYSNVELYLSGSIKKPSINFSTPLFKLRIK